MTTLTLMPLFLDSASGVIIFIIIILLLFSGNSLPGMFRTVVEKLRSIIDNFKKRKKAPSCDDAPIDRTDKVLNPDKIVKRK